jgi:hypothetical protein
MGASELYVKFLYYSTLLLCNNGARKAVRPRTYPPKILQKMIKQWLTENGRTTFLRAGDIVGGAIRISIFATLASSREAIL